MIRSMPAFNVWFDEGQPTHAPVNSTDTTPVTASTSCNTTSPPSAWSAGRITAMVASTCSRMARTIQSAEAVRSVCVSAVFAAVSTPAVVAHQGGWDEALLIGTPILVIVGLLWLAKRRVDAAANADTAESDTTHRAGPDVTGPDRRHA